MTIFLLDGLGALLSTLLLLVVAHWQPIFGMPQAVLYPLVPVAAALAVYSLGCYALRPRNWKLYLYIIATANLLYCCGTLGLVMYHFGKLTPWGVAYFLVEIMVLGALGVFEITFAKKA